MNWTLWRATAFVLLAAAWFGPTVEAQPNPDLIISNSPNIVPEGSTEAISINFTHNASGPAAGAHISMCHDPTVVDVQSVELGEAMINLGGGSGPGFVQPAIFTDGWYIGLVFDIFGIQTLAEGGTYQMAVVEYQALAAEGASTTLNDCALGSNDLVSTIVIFGQSIPPTVGGDLTIGPPGTRFRRGDFNEDGAVDIADPVGIGAYLFASGDASNCLQTGDANADGSIDVADMVSVLAFLFSGGSIAAPFPDCDFDLLSPLSCDFYGGGCP